MEKQYNIYVGYRIGSGAWTFPGSPYGMIELTGEKSTNPTNFKIKSINILGAKYGSTISVSYKRKGEGDTDFTQWATLQLNSTSLSFDDAIKIKVSYNDNDNQNVTGYINFDKVTSNDVQDDGPIVNFNSFYLELLDTNQGGGGSGGGQDVDGLNTYFSSLNITASGLGVEFVDGISGSSTINTPISIGQGNLNVPYNGTGSLSISSSIYSTQRPAVELISPYRLQCSGVQNTDASLSNGVCKYNVNVTSVYANFYTIDLTFSLAGATSQAGKTIILKISNPTRDNNGSCSQYGLTLQTNEPRWGAFDYSNVEVTTNDFNNGDRNIYGNATVINGASVSLSALNTTASPASISFSPIKLSSYTSFVSTRGDGAKATFNIRIKQKSYNVTYQNCLFVSVTSTTGASVQSDKHYYRNGNTILVADIANNNLQVTATPNTGYHFDSSQPAVRALNQNIAFNAVVNTYTIRFNANGGSGSMSDESMTYGTAKNLTSNAFTRTGYIFNGWNTNTDGTGTSYSNGQSVNNLTSANESVVTLYAQWTAQKVTVNFTDPDGGNASQSTTYTYGVYGQSFRGLLTRSGFTHIGWKIGSTTYQVSNVVTPDWIVAQCGNNASVSLTATAVWQLNQQDDTYTIEATHTNTISYVYSGSGTDHVTINCSCRMPAYFKLVFKKNGVLVDYQYINWNRNNDVINYSGTEFLKVKHLGGGWYRLYLAQNSDKTYNISIGGKTNAVSLTLHAVDDWNKNLFNSTGDLPTISTVYNNCYRWSTAYPCVITNDTTVSSIVQVPDSRTFTVGGNTYALVYQVCDDSYKTSSSSHRIGDRSCYNTKSLNPSEDGNSGARCTFAPLNNASNPYTQQEGKTKLYLRPFGVLCKNTTGIAVGNYGWDSQYPDNEFLSLSQNSASHFFELDEILIPKGVYTSSTFKPTGLYRGSTPGSHAYDETIFTYDYCNTYVTNPIKQTGYIPQTTRITGSHRGTNCELLFNEDSTCSFIYQNNSFSVAPNQNALMYDVFNIARTIAGVAYAPSIKFLWIMYQPVCVFNRWDQLRELGQTWSNWNTDNPDWDNIGDHYKTWRLQWWCSVDLSDLPSDLKDKHKAWARSLNIDMTNTAFGTKSENPYHYPETWFDIKPSIFFVCLGSHGYDRLSIQNEYANAQGITERNDTNEDFNWPQGRYNHSYVLLRDKETPNKVKALCNTGVAKDFVVKDADNVKAGSYTIRVTI